MADIPETEKELLGDLDDEMLKVHVPDVLVDLADVDPEVGMQPLLNTLQWTNI